MTAGCRNWITLGRCARRVFPLLSNRKPVAFFVAKQTSEPRGPTLKAEYTKDKSAASQT